MDEPGTRPVRVASTPIRAGRPVAKAARWREDMRRYEETIEVRRGRIGEGISGLEPTTLEGPAQFIWRDRLWRVLEVQARWVESGAWWTGPGVRAARGEDWEHELDGAVVGSGGDLLCEQEVWRVEAANGRAGSRGVYELANVGADDAWLLRAVVD
ncbi:DUF6504 family protein [Luteococcus sanguinis]|uniref:DUF6504 family protein n=1 Tax=Luteococcus sanguinis TaxID=174038 RepID=A0ABW1X3M7_9ACTN